MSFLWSRSILGQFFFLEELVWRVLMGLGTEALLGPITVKTGPMSPLRHIKRHMTSRSRNCLYKTSTTIDGVQLPTQLPTSTFAFKNTHLSIS